MVAYRTAVVIQLLNAFLRKNQTAVDHHNQQESQASLFFSLEHCRLLKPP
jgi:hypothetical protein